MMSRRQTHLGKQTEGLKKNFLHFADERESTREGEKERDNDPLPSCIAFPLKTPSLFYPAIDFPQSSHFASLAMAHFSSLLFFFSLLARDDYSMTTHFFIYLIINNFKKTYWMKPAHFVAVFPP